ncbi:MAG: hypothetical protein IJ901_05295 [Bacteroidaceae bacterium]|nr:hypothetical protein [Bacteroidaceae bacterium]
MKSIQFTSEVEEDLLQLVNLLVEKRYFSSNEYAFLFVEEIVTYIRKNFLSKLKQELVNTTGKIDNLYTPYNKN